MIRIIKAVAVFLASTLFAASLSGCAKSGEAKETVTVALWGNQLLENYAPWLAEQFPDVEFDFRVVNNSTDYYHFRKDRDALPDIMTVRRFSLRDVEDLKDDLLDLSDTELANSFYQSYLRNYTYSDGTVNWLPACAEVDDIIANKTLFEENNIPLPTDYESFVYACEEFEKKGIRGYAADMNMDYTCLATLQGLSISELTSTEGRQWRQEYESGTTDEPDKSVWLPAFEKTLDFIKRANFGNESLEWSATQIAQDFSDGKVAMFRGTGEDLTVHGTNYERVMLPYPGDTEKESWFLTYPAFQVAASASATKSDKREKLIIDIMTAMLSEDGMKHISTGKNMVAYNKDVTLELIPEFDSLKSYINENKIYIRLASSEIFSASKAVVQKMITGELTSAEAAYNEFSRLMTDDSTEADDKVVTSLKGYSAEFAPKGGNAAASAVYNTFREELGVDCMLGSSTVVTGDIPEGDYTESQLKYIINFESGALLSMNLTGEQLYRLVQYSLDLKDSRDSVAGDSTLPVSSGFEMTLSRTDDGYKVDKLTIDGKDMDKTKTYSVALRIRYAPDAKNLEAAGFSDYESLGTTEKNLLEDGLVNGGGLSEPTDYITLK